MIDLIDIFRKSNSPTTKIYYSENFKKVLNHIIPYNDIRSGFCYVDISDKYGYVKVMPTSKYFYILNKYSKRNKKGVEWIKEMKNNYISFLGYDDNKIESNYQYMRAGKFLKKIFDLKPVEVEKNVDIIKGFQKTII